MIDIYIYIYIDLSLYVHCIGKVNINFYIINLNHPSLKTEYALLPQWNNNGRPYNAYSYYTLLDCYYYMILDRWLNLAKKSMISKIRRHACLIIKYNLLFWWFVISTYYKNTAQYISLNVLTFHYTCIRIKYTIKTCVFKPIKSQQ